MNTWVYWCVRSVLLKLREKTSRVPGPGWVVLFVSKVGNASEYVAKKSASASGFPKNPCKHLGHGKNLREPSLLKKSWHLAKIPLFFNLNFNADLLLQYTVKSSLSYHMGAHGMDGATDVTSRVSFSIVLSSTAPLTSPGTSSICKPYVTSARFFLRPPPERPIFLAPIPFPPLSFGRSFRTSISRWYSCSAVVCS